MDPQNLYSAACGVPYAVTVRTASEILCPPMLYDCKDVCQPAGLPHLFPFWWPMMCWWGR